MKHCFEQVKQRHLWFVGSGLCIVAVGMWIFGVLPGLRAVPIQFPLSFELFSVDNFYDEARGVYQGEVTSRATYRYDEVYRDGRVSVLSHVFDVRTLNDEPIFSVSRLYAIDRFTGQHDPAAGDRPRTGYLFGPQQSLRNPVESFVYWHINYDAPAVMTYSRRERIGGLETLVYTTSYDGEVIDQTGQLQYLPGVPEERGVVLDPRLALWLDPVTGEIVKYEDQTTAYYYDQESGERIAPWNTFRNRMTDESVAARVASIQSDRFRLRFQEVGVPLFLLLCAGLCFLRGKRTTPLPVVRRQRHILMLLIPLCSVPLIVLIGWLVGVSGLTTLAPGLPSMKFTTAISFVFSGLIILSVARLLEQQRYEWSMLLAFGTLTILLLVASVVFTIITGIQTGIENLFFEDLPASIISGVVSRPSIGTIAGFFIVVLLGVLHLAYQEDHGPRRRGTLLAAAGCWCISGLALVGYATNNAAFYFAQDDATTGMAFHTAVLFALLGCAVVQLYLIDRQTRTHQSPEV